MVVTFRKVFCFSRERRECKSREWDEAKFDSTKITESEWLSIMGESRSSIESRRIGKYEWRKKKKKKKENSEEAHGKAI